MKLNLQKQLQFITAVEPLLDLLYGLVKSEISNYREKLIDQMEKAEKVKKE